MNKFIKQYFLKNIKNVTILSVISIIYTFLGLVIPYYNGAFLDILISNPNIDSVLYFAYFIIFLGLFSSVVEYFYALIKVKVTNTMSCNIMFTIIQHLRKIPILKFNQYDSTYLNQRINSDSITLVTFYIDNYISLFSNIFVIIAISLLIYRINIYILILDIVFIPIYIFLYYKLKTPLYKANYKFKETSNAYVNDLNDQYRINEEVKISANFAFWGDFIHNIFEIYIKEVLSFNRITYLFSSINKFLGLMFTSCVLIVGGVQIINNNMTIGDFTIVNAYFSILIQSIRYFFELGKQYQNVKVAYVRLLEVINIQEEVCGIEQIKDIHKIHLSEVKYPFIQKKINFIFEMEKINGIVGGNGVGKTTLINLLIGVLELHSLNGTIKINTINISDIDIYNLRKNMVSVMGQNVEYLNITVQELLCVYFTQSIESVCNRIHELNLQHLYFNKSFRLDELYKKN